MVAEGIEVKSYGSFNDFGILILCKERPVKSVGAWGIIDSFDLKCNGLEADSK